MQDGRMREKGLYRFYLYDKLSRIVVEGTCTSCNRGITKIVYDLRNNPRLIQFSDGSQTEYVYSALGEKLKTIHRTATPNSVACDGDDTFVGGDPTSNTFPMLRLLPSSVQNTDTATSQDMTAKAELAIDSTEYIGNFIFENERPDKFLFPGGYYSYAVGHPTRTGGDGGGCYYLTDHLGNNRVVVNDNGDIEQTTHYYPFGAVYADAGKNPDFQKFKYTGKELDLTHGLNTYDHGARQNYSILGVWDRVDPLAEKYYNISPYAVCGDNPINYKDFLGEDYNVYDDPDNQDGIIVSARLYCSNSDEKSARKAANFWNEQSYKYCYNGQYVIFSISVVAVDPQEIANEVGKENISDKQAVEYAYSQDKSGEANIYRTVPRNNLSSNENYMNINGKTDQSYIRIASDCVDTETGSHEVGHALGMMHTVSGIMTPASSDPNRTYDSVQQNIRDCIDNARGKRRSEGAGIGHYYNFYFYSHNVL